MGKAIRLQRAGEAEAVQQDQLVLQFEGQLEGVLRRTDRHIAELVRQLKQEDGRLVRTHASLGRAIRMRKDLAGAIVKAGLNELLDEAIADRFDDLADTILGNSTIAARAAKLSPVDIEAITAMKELRLADLLDWRDGVAQEAWRITVDGVLGLSPVDNLVADLSELLDTSLPRARTLYDTSVSTFSRQVNLLHATGDPDELFYYAGPVDSITRKFCIERVGKVFTRAEIDEMDNGQLPDVLITGGGYNCRHTFKVVSVLDEELQQLHETGGRLPHIQQQLDALERRKAA